MKHYISKGAKIAADFKRRMERFRLSLRGASLSKAEAKTLQTFMQADFDEALKQVEELSTYRE